MNAHSIIDAPVVRLAEPRDEDAIIAMLRELHGECGIRKGDGSPLTFSEDKVRKTVRDATNDRNTAFLGVVGRSAHHAEGSVLLHVRDQFYTDDKVLSEVWNFVSAPYRKSNNAKTLIAFSKALAASLKVPLIMGVISAERQAAKMRFLERQMGSQNVGRYYVFNYDQVGGNANV